MSPETIRLGTLLSQEATYNNKSVRIQGTVLSVVSLDEMYEQTVSTWFLNLPTTVETTASVTYFYLQDEMGQNILIKYPTDLEVSAKDTVALVGRFRAHGVTVEGFAAHKTGRNRERPGRTIRGSHYRRKPDQAENGVHKAEPIVFCKHNHF